MDCTASLCSPPVCPGVSRELGVVRELNTDVGKTYHRHRDTEMQVILHPQLASLLTGVRLPALQEQLVARVYLKPLLLLQTPSNVCQSPWLGNIIFGCSSLPHCRKYNKIKTNIKKKVKKERKKRC